MSALLARTAERLYWGARYAERGEDTARIVRAYNNLVVDYASHEPWSWEPLAAIAGVDFELEPGIDDRTSERTVLHQLIAERSNPGSIISSLSMARENLRATREVMPREAWQAVNGLWQYTNATASNAVERQLRDRFLGRVIDTSRQFDGVIESTMSRTDAWKMMRLGRLVERADMTTRVIGVAAAGLLYLEEHEADQIVNDEVRWMSVLRSVSAMQMYQRQVRGPIDGAAVVDFLLHDQLFPRSVADCLDEIRTVLNDLPNHDAIEAELDRAAVELERGVTGEIEGDTLDLAMDRLQGAFDRVHDVLRATYFPA